MTHTFEPLFYDQMTCHICNQPWSHHHFTEYRRIRSLARQDKALGFTEVAAQMEQAAERVAVRIGRGE